MTPKALLMGLLIMSFFTMGLAGFFIGTAQHYDLDTTQMSDFQDSFNQYTTVDAKLKAMQLNLVNIQVLNPITWNNIILLVINFFSVLLELPAMFNAIVVSMVTQLMLPAWVAYFIEGMVLLIVVFGALSALKGGKA